MAKKITIERLAVMIQNGFQETASKKEVDERFNAIDERFNAIDGKFNAIDGKFKAVDGTFRAIVDQLDIMSADIRDIKITLGPLVRMVAALDTDVQDLQMRMKRLEQRVGATK